MELLWARRWPEVPDILVLWHGTHELARVSPLAHGGGWVSQVARHRRDATRRPRIYVSTQAMAMRYAERWTRAHLDQLLRELPWRDDAHGDLRWQWPVCNPQPPELG